MDKDNLEMLEEEYDDAGLPEKVKRTRRKKNSLMVANEAVEAKREVIAKHQKELEKLIIARNEIMMADLEAIDLFEVLADPEMSVELAEKIQEIKKKKESKNG